MTERGMNDLEVTVKIEGVVTALATNAALFHATEGCTQIAHILRVQPYHAGVDALAYAMSALNIAGPHISSQPIAHSIGQFDRFCLIAKWRSDQHRAKNLLLEDAHRRGSISKERCL